MLLSDAILLPSGPVLMTVGPWRKIMIHAYSSSVKDLRASINVKDDLSVKINITFDIGGAATGLTAKASLLSTDGKQLLASDVNINGARGSVSFAAKAGELDLWFPVGYGKQPLYIIQLELMDQVCLVM